MDESYEALCSRLDKLRCENSDLRMMLDIVRENYNLQSKLMSTQRTVDPGRKMTLQWQDTLDEGRFTTDLQNLSLKASVPLTIQSLERTSSLKKMEKEQFSDSAQLSQERVPSNSNILERLVGEVAFQLERRILFHVFPGQSRLYGFTVLNIPEKILQDSNLYRTSSYMAKPLEQGYHGGLKISKHPLTGKVDEDSHYDLSQRHLELMDKLRMLGYSVPIHAPFAESVVNTYGILTERPDAYRAEKLGYNHPEFLRNIIIKMVPPKLLKDLLCLLSCLCFMARQDSKPLFMW